MCIETFIHFLPKTSIFLPSEKMPNFSWTTPFEGNKGSIRQGRAVSAGLHSVLCWLLPELLEGAEQAVTVAPHQPHIDANLTVLLLAYSFNRAVSTAHLRSLVLSLLLAWQCQCCSTSALDASWLGCHCRTCRVRHINLTIYVTAKEIRSNFSFFGNLT